MSTMVAPPPAPLAPAVISIPSVTPPSHKYGSNSQSPASDSRLRNSSADKKSPNLSRPSSIPKVIIKQEPTSPELATTRHRPRRLDLSTHKQIAPGALSSRPLTSKDSAGLALHDVGLACLSPGFNTSDPAMQHQLQRSMSVRDQQRLIIEARQKGTKPSLEQDVAKNGTDALFRPNKMPNTSRRKGPPPALSIAPPSHVQFANERVIQSAPLGASFTGLYRPEGPHTRQVVNQPSKLSHSSHIHHMPAIQTANRLPPIADVFPGELQSNGQMRKPSTFTLSPGNSNQPLPSPGYPPQFARPDFRSADDAVRQLTGGREELLPRIVHYGGHQPPTPPSPEPRTARPALPSSDNVQVITNPHLPPKIIRTSVSSAVPQSSSRRRDRDEYERDNGSPPLGRGPLPRRTYAPLPTSTYRDFASGSSTGYNGPRDSPEEHHRKKEKFMKLMEEAWDLFHT